MKSLSLLRHAKTERDSETGRDFDRRLTERGQVNAERVGAEVGELELSFDLVLCSPAARAAETAEFAGLSPRYDQRIYDASAGELLAIVQEVDDQIGRLMMIGHNPGFEQFASMLLGTPIDMPTGALIEIELPVDQWREVGDAEGRIVRFLTPKELT